jgi:hypothetical protein
MKKATKFGDFYKDSRWQQKRLEIMERDKWTCQSCGKSGEGVTLNVHHAYYESGKKPWEYPDVLLITWCEKCHKKIHLINTELMFRLIATKEVVKLLSELIGYSDARCRQSYVANEDYSIGYARGRINYTGKDAEAIASNNYFKKGEVAQ